MIRLVMTSLTAPDWWNWTLSNLLSAGQLIFTVAGFSLAIWQLVRTANASIASKKLLEKVRSRLLGNDLLVALPDLHKVEEELDEAVKGGDPDNVEKVLLRYTRVGGRIAGLLKLEEDSGTVALVPLLAQAMGAAVRAKAEISEGSDRTIVEITKVTFNRISKVSVETSALMARLEKRVSD